MSELTEKMKTMVGYCTSCGVQVMDLSPAARGKRALPNYCEHTIEMSDGSLLRVAVCDQCKPLLVSGDKVQETADRILKHHKIFWQGNKKDQFGDGRPDRFDKLTVSDPNSDIVKNRTKKMGILSMTDSEKVAQEERNLVEREAYQKREAKRLKDLDDYNKEHTKLPLERGQK